MPPFEMYAQHMMQSLRYPSESIPSECLREQCIIGIDEAGRGPVLGKPVSVLELFTTTKCRTLSIFALHLSRVTAGLAQKEWGQ